jgi:hypothetical protein
VRRQPPKEPVSLRLAIAQKLFVGVQQRLDIHRRPEGRRAYRRPAEVMRRNSSDHHAHAVQKNRSPHHRRGAAEALLPIVLTDQDHRVLEELLMPVRFEIAPAHQPHA